jgi:hypothetical protein
VQLARWNADHSGAWNRLRLALSRMGVASYFRGVEVQDGSSRADRRGRGALHDHVLLVVPAGVSLGVEAVWRAALAAGYGCVLDLQPLESRQKAARYVSKYVTKAADRRELVPWFRERVDVATGEITEQTRATYRTWSKSREWACSMAEVVEAARLSYTRSTSIAACEDQQTGPPAAQALSPPG